MADLKICRICLRLGGKMYKYDQYQLKMYYEDVSSLKINRRDELPHSFCYECAALLYKFHKFKQKCHRGITELKAILPNGPITHKSINKLKSKSKDFVPSLDIISCNERVKTYIINEKQIKVTEASLDKDDVEINNGDHDNENLDDIPDDNNVSDDVKAVEKLTNDELSHSDSTVDNDPDYELHEDDTLSDLNTIFIPEKDVIKTEEAREGIPEAESKDGEIFKNTEIIESNDLIINKCVTKRKNKKINSIRNIRENKYKFTMRQKKCLDSSKWRKISLTEEEAVKEFQKRASDPKYVQAMYHCKDCYKFFSKEDIMIRHFKLKHNPSIGPFECRFCHSRFRLECHLRKHIRMHYTRFECLVCNLVVAIETTALMHEEAHAGITRTCRHCGEQFRHMSTYYTHLRTHRSKYVCTVCGASFVSEAGVHQHKRVTHVGVSEHPVGQEDSTTFCERCQIKFETVAAYTEHLRSSALHADVEKAEHEEVPAPKRRHKRLRFGRTNRKKPTTCHHCGRHFETQSQCMTHHYQEHPGTSFCPPSERHICEICGVSLAPGSIAMHHNIHTREKLHSCETCGRQFHSTAGLKRHLVTHTGEKPYECPLCDKRFTQSNSMKLHYRTFHLKQPYPKRIRIKKKDGVQDVVPMESEEDSY
ncbi:zinc finger protein 491-like [Battus philenor]|uniref:zinc finger protein 491-like n=1 Tax=Battus philenor TaxID=42288 RepID=UPI0035CF601F